VNLLNSRQKIDLTASVSLKISWRAPDISFNRQFGSIVQNFFWDLIETILSFPAMTIKIGVVTFAANPG
jgi:hypothetical protein